MGGAKGGARPSSGGGGAKGRHRNDPPKSQMGGPYGSNGGTHTHTHTFKKWKYVTCIIIYCFCRQNDVTQFKHNQHCYCVIRSSLTVTTLSFHTEHTIGGGGGGIHACPHKNHMLVVLDLKFYNVWIDIDKNATSIVQHPIKTRSH